VEAAAERLRVQLAAADAAVGDKDSTLSLLLADKAYLSKEVQVSLETMYGVRGKQLTRLDEHAAAEEVVGLYLLQRFNRLVYGMLPLHIYDNMGPAQGWFVYRRIF
jgi:hypothetical protein